MHRLLPRRVWRGVVAHWDQVVDIAIRALELEDGLVLQHDCARGRVEDED
jgi:hypothetical protein